MEQLFDILSSDLLEMFSVQFDESCDFGTTGDDSKKNILCSEKEYFCQTGNDGKIPEILASQFAKTLARSRQSDCQITENGEPMVEISINYTSCAVESWRLIRNILEVDNDENNNRFSACGY